MAARILNLVLLFIAGAILGAVGTVAHQSTVTIAGVPVPWGITVALLAYTCLLIGLRLLNAGRAQALAAALGTIVMTFLFSLKGVGGSVLIPDDLLGKIWVVAPIVIAAIVIAWPRLPQRGAVAQNRLS
ncbi:hypothetical protein G3T36_13425 [Diaminobutyricibacter tongyongensis]|uniref:Histidinol dehydrogenase n=1 Tax=Leifsonia tongyongensis TaxID=1268043 RepID=A0A6L9XZM1_9MICO|nr:hypothetical protein [Diaminobutyricibacter tongyongensis]NEN06863.1 hypothetical protein [Diaminobutyricibacter tongyongensis]